MTGVVLDTDIVKTIAIWDFVSNQLLCINFVSSATLERFCRKWGAIRAILSFPAKSCCHLVHVSHKFFLCAINREQ